MDKNKRIISIIAAVDENNAIGKNNELLCHLKKVTLNHTVIMGRHTFESLPKGALPNRKNIVLSSNNNADFPGCTTVNSIEEAFNLTEVEDEVFIMGGGKVYKSAFNLADKLYITQIHHTFENTDTFFPEIKSSEWNLIYEEHHSTDEKHAYNYTFQVYTRKK